MGIRGMETYLERYNQQACYPVNVRDLVIKARQDGRSTTVVVDGLACLRYLYGSLPWIPGGQHKEFTENLRHFVENFMSLGAELIFFFDGPPTEVKMDEWKRRRLEKMNEVCTFFDGLKSDSSPPHRDSYFMMLPSNLGFVAAQLLTSLGCKVTRSIGDCDEEIARYAYQNRCLGILSQDTDFVIYQGAEHYWSMKNFDIHRMTTLEYDGHRLAYSLHLSSSHLPLLASLLGNDLIKRDQLSEFHRSLVNRDRPYARLYFSNIIECVARFIQNYPVEDASTPYLNNLAQAVFNDSAKGTLLQESIQSYNIAQPCRDDLLLECQSTTARWQSVLHLVREAHIAGALSQIYSIVVRGIYHSSNALEDYRRYDVPLSQVVLKSLRQKIYGVLLFEKPVTGNEPIIVRELAASDPSSLDGYVNTPAVLPKVPHPGLLALWNYRDKTIDEQRWALLCSTVNIDYNILCDSGIPCRLFIFILAVKYLRDEGMKFLSFELQALISSAVLLDGYSVQMLAALPVHESNARGIHLHTVVARAYSTIILLNASCGWPIPEHEANATNYQDGKLFHYKYTLARNWCPINELCENKMECIRMFHLVMNMCLSAV